MLQGDMMVHLTSALQVVKIEHALTGLFLTMNKDILIGQRTSFSFSFHHFQTHCIKSNHLAKRPELAWW